VPTPTPAGCPIAALLAVALLAGCGGGGSGAATPLTRTELVARGDAICAAAAERSAEARQTPSRTPAQAATLTQRLIGITRAELGQLRALSVPGDVRPLLDRYLSARREGLAVLERGLEAARRGDARAYAAAQAKMAAGQVQRLKLAQAVGFTRCSRPSAGG
jgi:hypothetical protein